jgi:hypothetical protein
VIARWLAVPGDAAWTAATKIAQLVPLVPTVARAPFSPRELVEGMRDRGGPGVARALGKRLAAQTRLSTAALDELIAGLSGERLHAERAELVAEAAAIAKKPKRARSAAYRTLFRRAESAASAVQLGRSHQKEVR